MDMDVRSRRVFDTRRVDQGMHERRLPKLRPYREPMAHPALGPEQIVQFGILQVGHDLRDPFGIDGRLLRSLSDMPSERLALARRFRRDPLGQALRGTLAIRMMDPMPRCVVQNLLVEFGAIKLAPTHSGKIDLDHRAACARDLLLLLLIDRVRHLEFHRAAIGPDPRHGIGLEIALRCLQPHLVERELPAFENDLLQSLLAEDKAWQGDPPDSSQQQLGVEMQGRLA
ncbi:hypothetical protein [Sphingopyxis macrogoltabida]|uniref:hypothetical protein n=1 Tax=Sphingopyxis macrogoltabida TaxID=33050 RepID=UPI001F3B4295|nr:hypothetical protein [Sphingopyxis macrogoltabida]